MERKVERFTKGTIREMNLINYVSSLLQTGLPLEEMLDRIAWKLPEAFSHSDDLSVRIIYDGNSYFSPNYFESPFRLTRAFQTYEGTKGMVEVCYRHDYSTQNKSRKPFSFTEEEEIDRLADIITRYINERQARKNVRVGPYERPLSEGMGTGLSTTNYVHRFISESNRNRDIYHDLMPFKVKEILLVSTLYDAFSLENEGRVFDRVLGEYRTLNISSMPRITAVSTINDVFKALKERHYDLVIIMSGIDLNKSVFISREIKSRYRYIPVFLLLNNNSGIDFLEEQHRKRFVYDRLFVWNGDSNIFFTMIKLVEDRINLDNDTSRGLVRIILLVEDSPRFYSRYLPILYHVVMNQTRRLIRDVKTDDQYKVLKMRARPKIILATTYQQAVDILKSYEGFMLLTVTDMKFPGSPHNDELAGYHLARMIQRQNSDLPVILQSSDIHNKKYADELGVYFIDKNSTELASLFRNFITEHLGFGDFVFYMPDGTRVGVAKTMEDFIEKLRSIPDASLEYHALHNHFSHWLMARGEIEIAKIIRPTTVKDFKGVPQIREYILNTTIEHRQERAKGKVVPFEEYNWSDRRNVLTLADGSMGGKGRGLAFIHLLTYNMGFENYVEGINIRPPLTFIIGTNEYDNFVQQNKLYNKAMRLKDYNKIRHIFSLHPLTSQLEKRLLELVKRIRNPLAVRSSGLFEDSLVQPFAGIFETYMLPNNHPQLKERHRQLVLAVKMVYASVFSHMAKGYIESINYNLDEEKMAVVIQEVVGRQHGRYYYPHISGVAQSYNYYPYGDQKPEDGYAVLAMGLGAYVVGGEPGWRFSPRYPKLHNKSVKDMLKSSQREFYAIDMSLNDPLIENSENASLCKIAIDEAESHGTLNHLVSTYQADNDRLVPGTRVAGPRVVDFAHILQYNYIPLAETIAKTLNVVKEAMGAPVEIEFAVDLNKAENKKPTFYLLQIKPMIVSADDYRVEMDKEDKDKVLVLSHTTMGNGLIKDLNDILYIPPHKFNKTKMRQMAEEIARWNAGFDRHSAYVLIGPGRWGSRDEFIGIPVSWPQISHARVIVETDLEGFPLEASSGSHFFHNVVSMHVGYFSVFQGDKRDILRFDYLDKLPAVKEGKFFRHVRVPEGLLVKMDGKRGLAAILVNQSEHHE